MVVKRKTRNNNNTRLKPVVPRAALAQVCPVVSFAFEPFGLEARGHHRTLLAAERLSS
jgi:hypothetical protein